MTPIDQSFQRAQNGDPEGFTDWVRAVELPLRGTLRRFARHADVESIAQEGLLRMWRLAPTVKLEGDNASLRYAAVLVRNLQQITRYETSEYLPDVDILDITKSSDG